MAEQAATSTVEGPGGTAAHSVATAGHDSDHFGGRPVSWIGTVIVCVGFVVGAIPFFLNPILWWLFWAGVAIAVVGTLTLAFARTLSEDWY